MDIEQAVLQYGLGTLGLVTAVISALGLENKINRLVDYHVGDLAREDVQPQDRLLGVLLGKTFAAGVAIALWISALQYFFPKFWRQIEFYDFDHRLAIEWFIVYALCAFIIGAAAVMLVYLCRRLPSGTLGGLGLVLAAIGFVGLFV